MQEWYIHTHDCTTPTRNIKTETIASYFIRIMVYAYYPTNAQSWFHVWQSEQIVLQLSLLHSLFLHLLHVFTFYPSIFCCFVHFHCTCYMYLPSTLHYFTVLLTLIALATCIYPLPFTISLFHSLLSFTWDLPSTIHCTYHLPYSSSHYMSPQVTKST